MECHDGIERTVLSSGVSGDWASHLIGQELTGLYGLDHAQTLAIMLPAIWTYKQVQKQEKLVQYGQRVWHIQEIEPALIAQAAIECTRRFFENMGVYTRLSDYGLDANVIPEVAKLKEHQFVQLGERWDITPEDVTKILELAL